MMLDDVSMPCASVHMGVYFRRRDAFMTEHLLDQPQVRPIFYKVCRKRMPESMGRYASLSNTRDQHLLLNHLEYGLAAQGFPETVEKKQVTRGLV